MAIDDRELMERVKTRPALERGFDYDPGCSAPQLHLRPGGDPRTRPGGVPLIGRDLLGSFAAISELAAWWRWEVPGALADPAYRAEMDETASELILMAAQIRAALKNYEETT